MWQIIKAEIKYNINKDYLYSFFFGVVLILVFQYYYAVVSEAKFNFTALVLLVCGLSVPLGLKISMIKEKRDRLLVLLPCSIRQIGIARMLLFGFYIILVLVTVSVLDYFIIRLFPNIISTSGIHLSTAGIVSVYVAVFYLLMPDIQGYIMKGSTFLHIPTSLIYKVSFFFLVTIGIIFYFPLLVSMTAHTKTHYKDSFLAFCANLHRLFLNSPLWTVCFVAISLILFVLAVLVFEKRKSYVE